jgi:hypothetical protein
MVNTHQRETGYSVTGVGNDDMNLGELRNRASLRVTYVVLKKLYRITHFPDAHSYPKYRARVGISHLFLNEFCNSKLFSKISVGAVILSVNAPTIFHYLNELLPKGRYTLSIKLGDFTV